MTAVEGEGVGGGAGRGIRGEGLGCDGDEDILLPVAGRLGWHQRMCQWSEHVIFTCRFSQKKGEGARTRPARRQLTNLMELLASKRTSAWVVMPLAL